MTKRLWIQWNRNKQSPKGKTAWGFGLRVGYWPCLGAPYLQLAVALWRLDLYWGRRGYAYPP